MVISMANVQQVDSGRLVEAAAAKLQEQQLPMPVYVTLVKTGPSRERPPEQANFWYMRSAAVLRQVYLHGPIGVSRLRTRYGSRKMHSVTRHHQKRAGGSVITDALNALEKAGYVKKGKTGREITPRGKSFLDKIASGIVRGA